MCLPVVVLAGCIPAIRLQTENSRRSVDFALLLCSITGAVLLWQLFAALSLLFLTISLSLSLRLKEVIHHSIDTIYIALTLTLVMPSFVLGDYSMHPARLEIDRFELLYYLISGVSTWLFHKNLMQVLMCPRFKLQISADQTTSKQASSVGGLLVLSFAGLILSVLDYLWLGSRFSLN